MKFRVNKENETTSKELFFETLGNLGLRLVVYTALAAIIFITGKFFWWAGFILFIILAVYLLSEFLTNGFVLFVALFTAIAYGVAYSKLKAANKSVEIKNDRLYLVLTNLLLRLFCALLLILGSTLFVFFFTDFFC